MIDKLEVIENCLELFANSKRRNYFTSFSKEQVSEILQSGKMMILCLSKNPQYPIIDWVVTLNLNDAIDELASKYKLDHDEIIQNFEFSKFKVIQ